MSARPDSAVLALDQGTTGSTAFVFGPEGEVLGRAYAEITQHYPSPGWVEHDAEEIWQKTRRDRKSTRLNSSHQSTSRMPSSA